MKNSKLVKIVAEIVLPITSVLSGCSNSAGGELDLISLRFQDDLTVYKKEDDRTETDKAIFNGSPEAYKEEKVILTGDFWKNYKSEH